MLKNSLTCLVNYFRPKTENELIHDWLAESSDLVDLERRQRDLTHNRAPFQMQHNMRAKGHYN